MKTQIVVLAVVIVVAIGVTVLPAMAADAELEGSFTMEKLENPAPVVEAIELYYSGTPTDVMTPQTEYTLSMTITDGSKLNDITKIKIVIKERSYSGGDSATDQATYQWTSTGWEGPSSSTWEIVSSGCTVPNVGDISGDWVLAFKPGKVAREKENAWVFSVTATDSKNPSVSGILDSKTMLWYGEITAYDTAYSFGIVSHGAEHQPIYDPADRIIDVTVIANGDYMLKSKSEDWKTADETYTATLTSTEGMLSSGQFRLENGGDGTHNPSAFVSYSYQEIPGFPAGSLTGPTDEAGDTKEIYQWLSVASEGLEPEARYRGTYYAQIAKEEGE